LRNWRLSAKARSWPMHCWAPWSAALLGLRLARGLILANIAVDDAS
jgi:hypothetical protein